MERLKRWSLFISPSRATIERSVPRRAAQQFDRRMSGLRASTTGLLKQFTAQRERHVASHRP